MYKYVDKEFLSVAIEYYKEKIKTETDKNKIDNYNKQIKALEVKLKSAQ
jgi:hypothetical protein